MDDIAETKAVRAIEALKARYFRAMDSKDWAALEAVFTIDLVADFRDATPEHMPDMLIHGVKPYLAVLIPTLAKVITVHHGHMPEIRVEDDDHASGIWAMEDWVWPGAGSDLPFRRLHGWGYYHESYRREDGDWKIAATRLTRLNVEVE